MSIQFTGSVSDILTERTGTSPYGPWRVQKFILEIPGEYPYQLSIEQWGDKIEEFAVSVGETLTAHIDLKSREHKGYWYTNARAWRIDRG